jgi:DNA-directed RNA polymerase specialized sigma24 family protein
MRFNKFAASSLSVACALTFAATAPASQAHAKQLRELAQAIEGFKQYSTTSWRAAGMPADTWEDGTQEVYLRMLKRVPRERWMIALSEKQSFERLELKRAVWTVIKRYYRDRKYLALDALLPMLADRADEDLTWTLAELVELALHDSMHHISMTQAQILMLYCQGHKPADIGRLLGLSSAQVSHQKYAALQKIRKIAAA